MSIRSASFVAASLLASLGATPAAKAQDGGLLARMETLTADLAQQKAELAAAKALLTTTKARLDALIGRKWARVNREKETVYRNDLAHPIEVMVSSDGGSALNFCHIQVFLDGSSSVLSSTVNNNPDYAKHCSTSFTVPPGSSYRVKIDGYRTGRLLAWWELR